MAVTAKASADQATVAYSVPLSSDGSVCVCTLTSAEETITGHGPTVQAAYADAIRQWRERFGAEPKY